MDFLFNRNDIYSFIFSLKPLLLLEGAQYLKKMLFLLLETVFFLLFLDPDLNGNSLLAVCNCIIQRILHSG